MYLYILVFMYISIHLYIWHSSKLQLALIILPMNLHAIKGFYLAMKKNELDTPVLMLQLQMPSIKSLTHAKHKM